MAEAGVSADALKSKIQEQMQAVYVEIEDMSGEFCHQDLPRGHPSIILYVSRTDYTVQEVVVKHTQQSLFLRYLRRKPLLLDTDW